jgi:hypothetical protein
LKGFHASRLHLIIFGTSLRSVRCRQDNIMKR